MIHKNRREMIATLPKHGFGAEVGVFTGAFSHELLRECTPKRLYLVDLFRGVVDSGDENGQNFQSINMEAMRPRLESMFLDQPVTVVQSDSVNWLMRQPRGFLDWVYLDSDHSYEHVLAELLASADTVKPGGFICGHDFSSAFFPGVVQAVHQFCMRFGMDLEVWDVDRLPSYKITNSRRELADYMKG